MTRGKPWFYHDWPRRDEARATDARPRPQRGRKNTRRWCRGKEGVEHVLDVRLNKYTVYRRERNLDRPTCYRTEWDLRRWWCAHERYCTVCGKIIDWSLNDDCPDLTTDVTRRRGGS